MNIPTALTLFKGYGNEKKKKNEMASLVSYIYSHVNKSMPLNCERWSCNNYLLNHIKLTAKFNEIYDSVWSQKTSLGGGKKMKEMKGNENLIYFIFQINNNCKGGFNCHM